MQKLESSSALSSSEMRPAYVENETSQVTNGSARNYTTSHVRQVSHENDKKTFRDEKTENQPHGLLTAPTRHAALATIPPLLFRVGSVRRLDSPCPWDRDQTTGESNCCIVEVTSKDILDQNGHFLVQGVLSTTAKRDGCFEIRKTFCESETFMDSKSVNHGLNELGRVCIQYLRTCFAAGSLGQGQAGTLLSGLGRYVLLARSCGADLEDHQSVFRTLWRVHRSWSLSIPC